MQQTIDLLTLFAWSYMLLGPTTGMYMGTWTSDNPRHVESDFHDYTSERRRTFRIAHINCFVFPYMCIMWGLTVSEASLSEAQIAVGASLMATATIFMTMPLFLSLKWHKAKNAAGVGVFSLIGGVALIAYGYIVKLVS